MSTAAALQQQWTAQRLITPDRISIKLRCLRSAKLKSLEGLPWSCCQEPQRRNSLNSLTYQDGHVSELITVARLKADNKGSASPSPATHLSPSASLSHFCTNI